MTFDLVNLKFNPGLVISKETQMALSRPLNNNVRVPFCSQWQQQHADVKQVSLLDEKPEYHQAISLSLIILKLFS